VDNLEPTTCGQLPQLVKLILDMLVRRADPGVDCGLLHHSASFRLKVGFGSIERSFPVSARFDHVMWGLVGKDIPHP
jgi:hypothetical protein